VPTLNARFSPATSVALDAGAHPFALTDAECGMSGDDWAWRFLRLNPFYRHDFALHAKRLAWLDRLRDADTAQWLAAFDEIRHLDARYFRIGSTVPGTVQDGTAVVSCTLDDYLAAHPDVDLADVAVRPFDSERLYGIADWFDPASDALPALPAGQSWFFDTIEPIVEMGDRFSTGPEPLSLIGPSGSAVRVGLDCGVRREERPRRVGRVERLNVNGEWSVTSEDLVDLDATRPGFTRHAEMLVAISLDGHLPPQIRAISKIAHDYRQLLDTRVSGVRAPRAGIEYRPLVFRPDPAVTQPFGEMRARLAGLADEPPFIRQNWYLALIDVAHPLPAQFTAIERRLRECQDREPQAATLAKRMRGQRRRKLTGDFWLKRALCTLELQLNLAAYCEGKPLAAEQVAHAVYDAADPLHRIVWRGDTWRSARRVESVDLTSMRDAARLGRHLSARGYGFLAGSHADDMLPAAR
jgi:hypothetical protein